MSRNVCLWILLLLLAPLTLWAEPTPVEVLNFPALQQIKGTVAVEGPLSHARYVSREGVLVPIARRGDLEQMAALGVVETEGFTAITISLQGEVKSTSFAAGSIGVLLVPDEEPVQRALREAKRVQFAIESVATLKSGDLPYYSAEPLQRPVIFPRYRVYLYNTLNQTVEANLYLCLSN